MVVEFLDATQEWSINLPPEPDRNRPVVAKNADGAVVRLYLYEYEAWWAGFTNAWSWSAIVNDAMRHGWSLWSVPDDGRYDA